MDTKTIKVWNIDVTDQDITQAVLDGIIDPRNDTVDVIILRPALSAVAAILLDLLRKAA